MGRARRGFTLLEVMIALAVLVTALVILTQTQSVAAHMTREAEQMVVASQLAQEKLTDVLLLVEEEGFQDDDVYEKGDFDDFGDDALNLEFKDLEDYHWEYLVGEVNLDQVGELTGVADEYMDENTGASPSDGGGAAGGGLASLGALGISNEMISEQLARYIREVRVRVWWGEDSEEAEEQGSEVVITTHVVNPMGAVIPGSDPKQQQRDLDSQRVNNPQSNR